MVRIAEQVRRRVGGGRYFAACASVRLREEVEAELKARLGADRVHRVQVQPADGPWNSVRHYQLERGLPVERTLYTLWGVHGEGELSASHPYAQLNLARDAWGGTGTHLLVWLDRVGETARFAGMAPDLWSVRALVEEFLTLEDFPPIPAVVPEDEGALRRLRAEAADKARPADVRAWSLAALADRLRDRGRRIEALELVEDWRSRGARDPAVEVVRTRLLASMGRPGAARRALSALGTAVDWIVGPGTGAQVAAHAIAEFGDNDGAVAAQRELLSRPDLSPTNRALTEAELASQLMRLGRVRQARQLLSPSGTSTTVGDAVGLSLAGVEADELGDALGSVSASLQAATSFVAGNRPGLARAEVIRALAVASVAGLAPDALVAVEALAVDPEDPPITKLLFALSVAADARGATIDGVAARFATAIQTLGANPRTRAWAALVLLQASTAVEYRSNLAPHLLPLANTVLRRCKDDPEPLGVAREVLSRLHLALGDRKRAVHHAAHLLAWAQEWRGPSVLVRIHALLADLHDDPAHADTAVDLARPRLSLYDLSHALQARARLRARHDDLPGARSDLAEALREVAAEGLRPELIRLHLAAASLPAGDDRADHAREALFLARTCRFIREEARALLVSVDLAPRPWGPHVRVQLDRATRIVRELGPPWLDPTVDRLTAATPPRSAPPG